MLLRRMPVSRLAGVAVITAMIVQLLTPYSVLRGDPSVFIDHANRMLDGAIPYLDFDFEHLPLSALIVLIPGLLERFIPGLTYDVAFVILSAAAVIMIAVVVDRTGIALDDRAAGRRWIAIAMPLLPFAMYRMDPWSTLAAALAFLALQRNASRRFVGLTLVGVAIKGWPIVLAGRDWLRGLKRRATILLLGSGVLGIVLLLLPGFRSGRSFDGIHLETLTGSATLLARLVGDQPHGIEASAGALYIAADSWAVVANALVGVAIWAVAARRARNESDAWLMTCLVLGLLLASPLLSAQFLLWVTPFAALVRRRPVHALLIAAGVMSTALLIWWEPTNAAWALLLVTRNLVLVATAAALLVAGRFSRAGAP
ncbi:MAG: hypothetical protein GY722_02650 [bacterium]|nr:hypothetical protein [bacterium]